MRKTDKKIENQLREVLTEVCDIALKEVQGFKWLTHFVNYKSFPNSLKIVCVFDTKTHLSQAQSHHQDQFLKTLISDKLRTVDIQLKDIHRQVCFDTEEECDIEHNGNWNKRYQ